MNCKYAVVADSAVDYAVVAEGNSGADVVAVIAIAGVTGLNAAAVVVVGVVAGAPSYLLLTSYAID